jgi:hypothetical protein
MPAGHIVGIVQALSFAFSHSYRSIVLSFESSIALLRSIQLTNPWFGERIWQQVVALSPCIIQPVSSYCNSHSIVVSLKCSAVSSPFYHSYSSHVMASLLTNGCCWLWYPPMASGRHLLREPSLPAGGPFPSVPSLQLIYVPETETDEMNPTNPRITENKSP